MSEQIIYTSTIEIEAEDLVDAQQKLWNMGQGDLVRLVMESLKVKDKDGRLQS